LLLLYSGVGYSAVRLTPSWRRRCIAGISGRWICGRIGRRRFEVNIARSAFGATRRRERVRTIWTAGAGILALAGWLMAAPVTAVAHPHVWVTVETTVV